MLFAGKNNPILFLVSSWKLILNFLKELTITVKSQSEYYESTDQKMDKNKLLRVAGEFPESC